MKRCPDFPTDFHWRDFQRYEPIDCNACYYACRGEAQAPLRLVARAGRDGVTAPRVADIAEPLRQRAQVVTCAGPARARRGAEMRDAGDSHATSPSPSTGERIAAVGAQAELRARVSRARRTIDCARRRAHAGPRRFAHARDLRPCRATRSRSCAPRASDYMEIARARRRHSRVGARPARARARTSSFALARAASARGSRRTARRPSR